MAGAVHLDPATVGMRPAVAGTAYVRGFAWLFGTVAFYVVLGLYGLTCILWSTLASALRPIMPGPRGAVIGRLGICLGFRTWLRVFRAAGLLYCDLAALEPLANERQLVVAPNHPSLLDAVLLLSRLPNAVCITKPEVWDNPCLGGGARLAGYIRNDAPLSLVRRAAAELRAGRQLLIFPEGTRTRQAPLGPLRGGFALMARAGGAPIQAVLIETNSPFLGKGWRFLRRPDFPLVFRVRLGRRFDASVTLAELEDYFRAELGAGPAA